MRPGARTRRDPDRRAAQVLLDAEQLGLVIPIDVEAIARLHDAEIRLADLDQDLSGMLVRDGARKIIAVASGHAHVRQRYTIAHELGHLLMHPGRPYIAESAHVVRVDLRGSTPGFADQSEEREANQFAAALLMPPELVSQEWSKNRGKSAIEALAILAKRFEVSKVAMQYRLINLGLVSASSTDQD